MKKFLPIVLGSDENAYGNCRLFSEFSEARPLMVYSFRFYATKNSRIMDGIKIKDFDSDEVFPDAMYNLLTEKKKEYENIIVIPCSDRYTELLSKYGDRFEGLIDNKFISRDLLERLDTKDRFYKLCEECGLDYPKTVIADYDEWDGAVSKSDFTFPIVVKPENSNGYDYCHAEFEGKKKVYFVYSEEEYKNIIGKMKPSLFHGKLIIQEFIPGGDDAMRVMNCYSDNSGKVRFMSLGQPVLEEYSPHTIGNYAAIISRSDEGIYKKIENFLNGIGYVGFANFDMKYDRRTGKYLLFEINPRPGRSSYYVRGTGYNLMKIAAESTYGEGSTETVYADKKSLWTEIPKGVIMKYVKDPGLKKEIRMLYKEREVYKTLFNKNDFDIHREYAITKRFFSYYRSFARYFFDKNITNEKG